MVIFHSYVSLPEGKYIHMYTDPMTKRLVSPKKQTQWVVAYKPLEGL